MSRFYFDIKEGERSVRDEVGLDLPSVAQAESEAVRTLVEIARDACTGEAKRIELDIREDGTSLATVSVQIELRRN